MFDMMAQAEDAPVQSEIRIPDVPELSRRELMTMERETTGLYLTGHPMDDYRELLRQSGASQIGEIMEDFAREDGPEQFHDEQQVTICGIVQTVKNKTTKNNSMMAYVTLEDDTASMELLVFSNVLGRCGGALTEGAAVAVQGKISVRDDKDPQLIANQIQPIEALEQLVRRPAAAGRLYLRLPAVNTREDRKTRAVLDMFPGKCQAVLYYTDSGRKYGAACQPENDLLQELREILGEENVVLKQ
jgi:DNA polymerase-3 subunit alpha